MKKSLPFFLAFLLLGLAGNEVSASVMVAPTRITLEPGERVGQVTVMNTGEEPITLRISFVNYRMQSDGKLEPVEKTLPGEHFADKFLRYSPRRIRLAPGEGQVVRVLAQAPSGESAEYRSHLRFQTEPPERNEAPAESPSKGFSVQITPLYGVSIPVIVRTGNLHATAGIEAVRLDSQALRFNLTRTGNRSLYGNIRVTHVPDSGKARVIAETRGVGVYPPLQVRYMQLPLNQPVSGGRLRVEYLDPEDKSEVLASAEHEI